MSWKLPRRRRRHRRSSPLYPRLHPTRRPDIDVLGARSKNPSMPQARGRDEFQIISMRISRPQDLRQSCFAAVARCGKRGRISPPACQSQIIPPPALPASGLAVESATSCAVLCAVAIVLSCTSRVRRLMQASVQRPAYVGVSFAQVEERGVLQYQHTTVTIGRGPTGT
jgi:hypothetical protein